MKSPSLIAAIEVITLLYSGLKNFIVGTRDTLEDSNNQLSQVKQTIDDIDYNEDEQEIKKQFDETDSAYLKLTNNVIDTFGVFKNPKNFGKVKKHQTIYLNLYSELYKFNLNGFLKYESYRS